MVCRNRQSKKLRKNIQSFFLSFFSWGKGKPSTLALPDEGKGNASKRAPYEGAAKRFSMHQSMWRHDKTHRPFKNCGEAATTPLNQPAKGRPNLLNPLNPGHKVAPWRYYTLSAKGTVAP